MSALRRRRSERLRATVTDDQVKLKDARGGLMSDRGVVKETRRDVQYCEKYQARTSINRYKRIPESKDEYD